jgi:hypothetical protein
VRWSPTCSWISAAATGNETLANAYYAAMDQLANNLMPAATIANLATGLLLVFGHQMGPVSPLVDPRSPLAPAVVTTLVGMVTIDNAIQETIAERAAGSFAGFGDVLLPATAATPFLLLSGVTIAITKPWGRTPRARRTRGQQNAPGDRTGRGNGRASSSGRVTGCCCR